MSEGNTVTSSKSKNTTQVGSKINLDEDFSFYDIRNKDYQHDGELNVEAILHDMQRIMIYTLDPFLFYQKYHTEQGNVMEVLTKKEMFEKLFHTKIGTIQITKQVGKRVVVDEKEINLKMLFEEGVGIHANSRKFEARSVKFITNDPRDFPLFKGYPWKPLPDDKYDCKIIDPWLDHVAENLCCNDGDVYDYLINWLAFIVQKPGVKTTVAPMIIGEHGTGKGDFFLDIIAKLFGRYALPNVTKIEDITGRFNGIVENMVFIGCNEMHDDSNSKKLNSNALKSLITEYDIVYERKCINQKKGKFYGNLIFFSNHAIPIDFKDMKRRVLVIEANYKVAQDLEYFGKLRKNIDHPMFMQTLFTYLATKVNLDNFEPRKIPETKAMTTRLEATTPPWELFFMQNIEMFKGDEIGAVSGGVGDGWITTECYSSYVSFCNSKGFSPMNDSNFGINLKKFVNCKQRKRDGALKRYYYLNERGNDLLKKHQENLDKMEPDDKEKNDKEIKENVDIAIKKDNQVIPSHAPIARKKMPPLVINDPEEDNYTK